jgi:hypothetical protein
MKKLITTLSLAAAVVGSFAAGAPAKADEAPRMLPILAQPDLSDLKLKPIAPLSQQLTILWKKAELTSQIFVFQNYHPVYNQNPHPHYPVIWCYVKNSGLKDSGLFKTFLRIHRYGTPYALQGYATMALPAGHGAFVGVQVYAPYGLKKVFTYADATYAVDEYNESNNFDIWDAAP